MDALEEQYRRKRQNQALGIVIGAIVLCCIIVLAAGANLGHPSAKPKTATRGGSADWAVPQNTEAIGVNVAFGSTKEAIIRRLDSTSGPGTYSVFPAAVSMTSEYYGCTGTAAFMLDQSSKRFGLLQIIFSDTCKYWDLVEHFGASLNTDGTVRREMSAVTDRFGTMPSHTDWFWYRDTRLAFWASVEDRNNSLGPKVLMADARFWKIDGVDAQR
jgi:hypothetical protein